MGTPSVLAIDQGTTGSTCLVLAEDGRVLGRAYPEAGPLKPVSNEKPIDFDAPLR